MNVQDLASLSDQIWQLTGLRVRETVPDWLFQQADEVVIVDVTPRALLHRLERGVIYPAEKAKASQSASFRSQSWSPYGSWRFARQHRRWKRGRLERQACAKRPRKRYWSTSRPILQPQCYYAEPDVWPTTSKRYCIAVYVHSKEESSAKHAEDRPTVDRHLRFAENLHIATEVIHGKNRAQALMDYARKHGVTRIFLNRAQNLQGAGSLDWTLRTRCCSRRARWRSQSSLNAAVMAWPPLPIPEDEAGALLHAGYVSISAEITVEEAIGGIRQQAEQVEMIYYAYVLDESRH